MSAAELLSRKKEINARRRKRPGVMRPHIALFFEGRKAQPNYVFMYTIDGPIFRTQNKENNYD